MKQRLFLLLCALLLAPALLLTGEPARATSGDGAIVVANDIIVSGARGVRSLAMPSSPELNAALSAATPFIVTSYAKGIRRDGLAIQDGLRTALSATAPFIVTSYARSIRRDGLDHFPRALLNDTTPPHAITPPRVERRGNQIFVSIDADEFVTCVIRYGTQPGVYTQEARITLFGRRMEVPLDTAALARASAPAGLQTGAAYYYRYSLTDLSSNSTESAEQTFTINTRVYVALLLR